MRARSRAGIARAVALAAAAAFAAASPAAAAVKQVRMGVKGAVCATCAFALRKAFQRLPGIEEAKLDTKAALMRVRMKEGYWPDFSQMREKIKDAGFVPTEGQVDLVVTGTLAKVENRLALSVDGMKAPVTLAVRPGPTGAADLERRLGQSVELEGRWKPSPETGGAGELSVTAVRAK